MGRHSAVEDVRFANKNRTGPQFLVRFNNGTTEWWDLRHLEPCRDLVQQYLENQRRRGRLAVVLRPIRLRRHYAVRFTGNTKLSSLLQIERVRPKKTVHSLSVLR